MIDVGGEIGSYSTILSKFFKTVHSFEPNIENYSLICKTKLDNNIENLIIYNKAVGDSISRGGMCGPYMTELDVSGNDFDIVSLDSMNFEGEVSFIKIDVEGYEFSVLKGSENLINIHKPIIYLETHPTMVTTSKIDCEEWLNSHGYKVIKEITPIDKFWVYEKL